MTSNVTVVLESGVYRLTHPLRLDSHDSGTNGHTIVWTAETGANAVISGAVQISGWRKSDPAKNIWEATVPRGLNTRQIYVDGMRASMDSALSPIKLERANNSYIAANSMMAHWRNPSEIEFVYPNQLSFPAQPMCPVASIKGRLINMAQPCWNNSNLRKPDLVGWSSGFLTGPAYIENAYELLSQPGQFYLDRHRHTMYYIPRPGEDMSRVDVEAPVLQTLVEGIGTAAAPIHDITFSGIQFSYATWLQPSSPAGFSEIQSNYTVTGSRGYAYQGLCHLQHHGACPYGDWTKEPGNVSFVNGRAISFQNDRFIHLGGAGINLDDGSQNDTVQGCVFTDISGNGVELGGVDAPMAKPAAQTTGDLIADNHIYGIAVEYPGGVGILAGYIADTSITHNQIDNVPYVAISVGWGGWLDKVHQPSVPNYAHGNTVSDNLIFDFMQVVKDGGGIYTQGILGHSLRDGLLVTGNVLHDQLDWGGALKADDGTTYVTYDQNVLYDDTYDWDGIHGDYRKHARTGFDPELIENNWWQQGDPNAYNKGIVESNNHIISGPDQAPSQIRDHAGLEPAFQPLLSWQPDNSEVPNPPQEVSVLFAFRSQAYVIWHPSYAYGSSSVVSYTVTPCGLHPVAPGFCKPIAPSVTVPASQLKALGYAIVPGLRNGAHYRFVVSAQNGQGSSVPSVPSREVTVAGWEPSQPGKPTHVWVQTASRAVSIGWYRPSNSPGPLLLAHRAHIRHGGKETRYGASRAAHHGHPFVLGYIVTSSTGQTYSVSGLQQLIDSNTGSKGQLAIGDLSPTKRYRFSIVAITPGGDGPAARTGWINPGN